MNKGLLLLLITIVQSRSDGILLPPRSNSDKFDESVEDLQLEEFENLEAPYSFDLNQDNRQQSQTFTKRSPNDVLTRRSALDKNFMRFGRNSDGAFQQKFFRSERSGPISSKNNFFRFGRALKDNFIRFGRGGQDNFIRFGRGGKDSFIRFGRAGTDDFFRSGKSGRENFIRFGKADKNFMRFGRDQFENDNQQENVDNQEYFSHLGDTTGKYDDFIGSFERMSKSPGKPDNFIRFGKNGNQKEGRNGTNFLRFGKKDQPEAGDGLETDDSDPEVSNQDLKEDSSKYGSIVRIKRRTAETITSEKDDNKNLQNEKGIEKFNSNSGNGFSSPLKGEMQPKNKLEKSKIFDKRSVSFFEVNPEDFPRRLSPILVSNSWQNSENYKNSRLTPFFPVSPKFPSYITSPDMYLMTRHLEPKRNQGGGGGSNFIRFG